MFQFILMLLSMMISILFMNMKHPLAMGLILLLQTFLICLISGILNKTFWFSYILFLIFLGGMLILFIYVTSLASNEMFSLSIKLLWIILLFLLFFSLSFFMFDMLLIKIFNNNLEMLSNSLMMNFIEENTLNLNKLYNFPTNLMTFLMINYLLLTLIIIVKITINFNGPLRNMY